MKIPVYIINGFLDSGKTEFIQYTLSQPYFECEGKTWFLGLRFAGGIRKTIEAMNQIRLKYETLKDEDKKLP